MTRLHDTARAAVAATLIALVAICLATPASATPSKAPQRLDAVFIGDRLVDVAYNLGFVAEGAALRCSLWPMCDELKNATQILGCPNRILRKTETVPDFLKERGITRVIVERTPHFCIYKPEVAPEKAVKFLKGLDARVQYVDFAQGVPEAIRQTAEILGVPERGAQLAARYEESFATAKAAIPAGGLGKRVVILNGVHQLSTGKNFVRVELAGGYSDQYMLEPLGCENVGDQLFSKAPKMSKGHAMIRSLKGLLKAKPDAIVMTGHCAGVQQALRDALAKHPQLKDVPALRDMAVYTLPFYADAGVIEYPSLFMRWLRALQ